MYDVGNDENEIIKKLMSANSVLFTQPSTVCRHRLYI